MEKQKGDNRWFSLAIILLLLIFQQFASKTGGFIANLFSYDRIDEFNTFAWISVHHIVQMLVALTAIWIIVKTIKIDFGFRFGNIRIGLRRTAFFTIIIFIYVVLTYLIGYSGGLIQAYNYPLNVTNVVGTLGFQLLLSGTSEEILFRALPIAVLSFGFGIRNPSIIRNPPISYETIITALLFSVAHISWTYNPFSIKVDWFQLAYAFILGIFYGLAYQKSKSIIYPMAMHGISNVLMVGIGYVFAFVYR